jgi:5-methylcytosine-specific restriction enzyme A
MPTAALRPCSVCRQLGCTQHKRQDWDHEHPRTRIRGRRLQRLRHDLFSKQPLCVLCLAKGRTTIATIRDHIVNLARGGQDVPENTQAICVPCHDEKTQRESVMGRSGDGGDRSCWPR